MGLRDSLKSNNAVTYGIVGIIVAFAIFLFWRNSQNTAQGMFFADRWALDLNTMKVVRASHDQVSPFDTGSGEYKYPGGMKTAGAGVDLYLYACESSLSISEGMTLEEVKQAGVDTMIIGRLSDESVAFRETRESIDSEAQGPLPGSPDQMLYSSESADAWFGTYSEQAVRMMQSALQACGDGIRPEVLSP